MVRTRGSRGVELVLLSSRCEPSEELSGMRSEKEGPGSGRAQRVGGLFLSPVLTPRFGLVTAYSAGGDVRTREGELCLPPEVVLINARTAADSQIRRERGRWTLGVELFLFTCEVVPRDEPAVEISPI
jgi:hypothetical protein